MDLSKLLDFLSVQHKGFAVSFLISLPLFYTVFYVYDDRFALLDVFDRIVFSATAGILYHSAFYSAAIYGNLNAHNKNMMAYAIPGVCSGCGLALIMRIITPSPIWMLACYFGSPIIAVHLIERSVAKDTNSKRGERTAQPHHDQLPNG